MKKVFIWNVAEESGLVKLKGHNEWCGTCQVPRNLCKLSRTRGFGKSQADGAIGPLPLHFERSRLDVPVQPAGTSRDLQPDVEGNPDPLTGRRGRGVRGLRLDPVGPDVQPRVHIPLGWAFRPDEAESFPLVGGSPLPYGHDTGRGHYDLGAPLLSGDRLHAQPQRDRLLVEQAWRYQRRHRKRGFSFHLAIYPG